MNTAPPWRLPIMGWVLGLAIATQATPAAAAAAGEAIYERCQACHAIDANRTGPQHCGLFGRRAGQAPGFTAYSDALKASGIVWSRHTLDTFLRAPMQAVPGTTMGYAGIQYEQERRVLIDWLQQATQAGKRCSLAR